MIRLYGVILEAGSHEHGFKNRLLQVKEESLSHYISTVLQLV